MKICMSRDEMLRRRSVLNDKLLYSCYGLFDALKRFDRRFDWIKKCSAYERAVEELDRRLAY